MSVTFLHLKYNFIWQIFLLNILRGVDITAC